MKSYIILALAILLTNAASALEISTEYDTNIIVKEFNDPINFILYAENATPGTYNLFTLADLNIEPKELFEVTESGSFEKDFTITPRKRLDIDGLYTFTMTLNHREVEKVDERFTINFVELKNLVSISTETVTLDSQIIEITVENKENVKLNNLTAKFSSILFDFEETFNLKPNGKTKIAFQPDPEVLKRTEAGVYIIDATFETPKGDVKVKGNLYLGEKKGISTVEDSGGLLIRTNTITKTNVGNTVESTEIKIKKNIFSRLFTSFNIEPTSTNRNGLSVEYSWFKLELDPTETYKIKAKTNYIFPILILIILIILIVGIKRFTETKLEIIKSVQPVKTKRGEFALRINLNTKTRKDVENVTLIDKVPAIVKIYNKFGSLKPDKVDPESRRLHWHIGDLAKGEERSFSYIVYSKVGIVGKFSLPSAAAIFEKEGNLHEVESNKVFFLNEQA